MISMRTPARSTVAARARTAPEPAPSGVTSPDGLRHRWWLAGALGALAAGIAASSTLGPLLTGVMQYRTSATMENQFLGSDAAALIVIAPLATATAVMAVRGRRAAAPLASGIGVYALYTYSQNVIGQEYLRLPGNAERFFPLLLAVFIAAEAVVILAGSQLAGLPPVSRRLERATAVVLLLVAAFLLFALHLPSMLTAWSDPDSLTEYASAPTPFWMVKLMDLGIVVPVAVSTGIGLWRGAAWARGVLYPLLTGYTCLSISVSAMGAVMWVRDDPDASLALASGFAGIALALVGLLVALYRPLMRSDDPAQPDRLVPAPRRRRPPRTLV